MIKIILNGQEKEFHPGTGLEDLLNIYKLNLNTLVVEHNMNVIPREELGKITLEDNDVVELITFVGGG